MRLNMKDLAEKTQWEKAGIKLPNFDRQAMIKSTEKKPQWVHFGAGNIFRAYPAALAQSLLEEGLLETGIIVAEAYDGEIIDKCLKPFDNLCLAVTLKADGTTEKKVIASIASSYRADKEYTELKSIFANPSLQMVSFTITEKAYNLKGRDGLLVPEIIEDLKNKPQEAKSFMGCIAALCHERYTAGALPLTLVSMDNCSHNGDLLFDTVKTFAKGWVEHGTAGAGFLDYVQDRKKLSFPWTMIDKITPRPDDSVRDILSACGIEDMQGITTEKNSYVAPFVNAEEPQYLAIEDVFPNGRPPLEKTGVLFTDKETVDKIEKMKVCTCLNPLHTALAIFGCLLGYKRIAEEMKNPDLVKLVEGIGYRESLPVVVDPGIINPKEFLDTVIKIRLPNPFMPDTPQRIATDTSHKMAVRFGETIKAYLGSKTLKVDELKLIPLVLAAWLRYLLGIDDEGKAFTVNPDSNYESLSSMLNGIELGQSGPFHDKLSPILSNPVYFGVNLYEAGLGKRVEAYFEELLAGPGAVAKTLKAHTSEKA